MEIYAKPVAAIAVAVIAGVPVLLLFLLLAKMLWVGFLKMWREI